MVALAITELSNKVHFARPPFMRAVQEQAWAYWPLHIQDLALKLMEYESVDAIIRQYRNDIWPRNLMAEKTREEEERERRLDAFLATLTVMASIHNHNFAILVSQHIESERQIVNFVIHAIDQNIEAMLASGGSSLQGVTIEQLRSERAQLVEFRDETLAEYDKVAHDSNTSRRDLNDIEDDLEGNDSWLRQKFQYFSDYPIAANDSAPNAGFVIDEDELNARLRGQHPEDNPEYGIT